MAWTRKFQYLTSLLLSALLPVFASSALMALPTQPNTQKLVPKRVGLNFKIPNRGRPPVTIGGATRGNCSTQSKLPLSLVPTGSVGVTTVDHPSFFIYVPTSSARTAEFLLLGNNDRDVLYQTLFELPKTSGIIHFPLPKDAPALQVGQRYHWYVTVLCNPALGPSGNPTVEGWVERTEQNPSLTAALKRDELDRHPTLYAESGIWHETLTTLAELRRRSPNSMQLMSDWRGLLQSVGLGSIANEPLTDCCKASTQTTQN